MATGPDLLIALGCDIDHAGFPIFLDDLRTLAAVGDTLVEAALQATADRTERRKAGKLLGVRHVSGDLTDCRRLRFDVPGERPQRFRIVYTGSPTAAVNHVLQARRRSGAQR